MVAVCLTKSAILTTGTSATDRPSYKHLLHQIQAV